ncbi:hypothetical protein [Streptomyces lancefieldiae]|uniref:Uncharacterized protein n=1 Tax=Streptomyces lancefieldiae TaxID=3075520 RepID=A0ABU3AXY4_9ACTN|nr:hypothetical protein [Streptomyces sp. DSM 40712]MDT0614793.1 hypothetical protein [Streptomyces sp. DSM 40712]
MPPQERRRRAAAIQDAGAARDELRLALDEVGVRLPSLGLDSVSLAGDYLPPLVDLGRCNPGTARQLAAALREGGRSGELNARVREGNRRSTNRP